MKQSSLLVCHSSVIFGHLWGHLLAWGPLSSCGITLFGDVIPVSAHEGHGGGRLTVVEAVVVFAVRRACHPPPFLPSSVPGPPPPPSSSFLPSVPSFPASFTVSLLKSTSESSLSQPSFHAREKHCRRWPFELE